MADSKGTSAWQGLRRLACLWQGLCLGVLVAWSLTYWSPVHSVVDQLATNRAMAICALVVLMTVGCIPAVILETIDDIRRFRQKTRDAASWRNGTSQ